ncbi:hypothetical protein [Salegentibacter chungangensis]|uniref:DUF2892 domain-containing protein n=1 Tax=Salegentibacter chungangensis TaxID=1335724 RepID=A0ABW3NQS3_9FLAO
MKNRLLKGWTIQRSLFLIMGILVIFQSADAGQWLGLLLGGYIAFMGLFAFGCAGGGCSIPNKKETDF